jgi:hypothetical protein
MRQVIKLLAHTEIDREKWDHCISQSAFETIYPYSWYLDLVSPGWDALVLDDFRAVMPLTWTKKMGFRLLLQPVLAQQLGVFTRDSPGTALLEGFLDNIPARFRYIDICLNKKNRDIPGKWDSIERHNYELDLSVPEDSYNTNTRRNLQKGQTQDFDFRSISTKEYLYLKFHGIRETRPAVRWSYLENLFEGLLRLKKAEIFGLFREDELQAAAILGYAVSRTIYLNGCNSDAGKENRAMFVLMDRLISRSRGAEKIFDFEGSNIPGVARFYEGFGGKRTIYPRIVKTSFPFLRKVN